MARFFRAFFSLVLVLYLIIMLALFIPPLIGVSTVTTTYNTEGNQALGTVDYSLRKPLSAISAGDKLLVTESSSVNVYTVQSIDAENNTVMVNTGSGMQELTVKSYVQKLIAAVPMIGFVTILLQSAAGFLVLGLTAVLLILLVILMSIRCRKEKNRRKKQGMSRKEKKQKESMETYNRSPQDEQSVSVSAEGYRPLRTKENNTQAAAKNTVPDHTTVVGETYVREKLPELDEEYEDFPPKAPQSAEPVKKAAANQERKPEITKTVVPVKSETIVLPSSEKKDLPVDSDRKADVPEEPVLPAEEINTETERSVISRTEKTDAPESYDAESYPTEPVSDSDENIEEDVDEPEDDMSELAVSDMILASVQETDLYDHADEESAASVSENGSSAAAMQAEEVAEEQYPAEKNVRNSAGIAVDADAVSEVVRDAVQDIVVDKVVEIEKTSSEGGDDSATQQIMLTINIKVV